MIDPAALLDLASRLHATFERGQLDMDADELREACRPVVPHTHWERAHAWKLSTTIRDAYERGCTLRGTRYRLPALIEVVTQLAQTIGEGTGGIDTG